MKRKSGAVNVFFILFIMAFIIITAVTVEFYHSQGLLKICDNNLALISTVLRLEKRKQNLKKIQLDNEELFNYFVQTLDKEQLKLIHILAVLGTYEFETLLSFIRSFGNLN